MGCQCQGGEQPNQEINSDKNNQDKKDYYYLINELNKPNSNIGYENLNGLSSKENNFRNGKNQLLNEPQEPQDKFSKYIFGQINKLRQNPQSFIDMIENAKKNIKIEKGIKIYKSSVKVALSKGESAFDDAIEILKNTEPMDKLIYNPNFVVEPPKTIYDILTGDYINNSVKAKIDSGIDIKSFWRDLVRDPETCLILTIVDDTGKNGGKKRDDILDRSNKFIGISSVQIGKSFSSYIVLG